MPLAIFDLDNTLVDRDGAFRRWANEFVTRHGLDPVSERRWLIDADGEGYTPRPAFAAALRDRYGLAEPPDALLAGYRERVVALLEPDPRVAAALDRLRAAGWRVAIATNGTVPQQRAKIRRAGLADRADAIAISDEVGVKKPDPRIFEVAASRAGARLADGGWMVGDCPTRDIAGGQGVGLRTIWLHHGRTWDPSTPAPDAIVDSVPATVPVLTVAGS